MRTVTLRDDDAVDLLSLAHAVAIDPRWGTRGSMMNRLAEQLQQVVPFEELQTHERGALQPL